MAIPLRQSTASQEVILGPFLDTTDANTPENALTIANTDIKIWVQGAASTANKTSGGATYITSSAGLYLAVFDAADLATLGAFVVFVHVAGALPVRVECVVLTAANYDAAIAGVGVADVNVVSISGGTTAADNLEAAADGTGYNLGNGAIVASQVTGDVGGDVAGQVLGALTHTGTAQAGAATTITLDVSASAVDDFYVNQLLVIQAGTGAGQARFVTDYVGATKVATVATWATTPDATSVFALLPFGAIAGASAPTASQVADEVQTRTIAAVTTVNGLAANVITAASIENAAIGLTELAANVPAAIAAAVRTDLATELGRLDVGVSTRATQASVDTVDGVVDAIKSTTDGLHNFDPAMDTVEANVKQINNVPLIGDGSTIPWGPA